jgi:hypothetical protein
MVSPPRSTILEQLEHEAGRSDLSHIHAFGKRILDEKDATEYGGIKLSFEGDSPKHSQKPDSFFEIVRKASPGPRLEMFARSTHKGFMPWGNEAPLPCENGHGPGFFTCDLILSGLLSVNLEKVKEGEDLVNLLFYRKDSQTAARQLLGWLRQKGGKCTQSEMSSFARSLKAGEFGPKFSKTNFYKSVLRHLLHLGLVTQQVTYDFDRRKMVLSYRIVHQPLTKHPPVSPSLSYLVYRFAEQ